MPELNNVDQLRKWFRQCPALSDDNRFRVDYLSESPTEYAIYASPSTITYRENVLGEEVPADIQTLNFICVKGILRGRCATESCQHGLL